MIPYIPQAPNQDAGISSTFFPLSYCKYPDIDSPRPGWWLNFDLRWKPPAEGQGGPLYHLVGEYDADRLAANLQSDDKMLEILTELASKNWDASLHGKLRSRIKWVFNNVYLGEEARTECQWLADLQESDPERYEFIKAQSLDHTDPETTTMGKMRLNRILDDGLYIIAEWCMANYSVHTEEWCNGAAIQGFDLTQFEPAEVIGKREIAAAGGKVVQLTPKELSRRAKLAAMTPAQRDSYLLTEKLRRQVKAARREFGVDQEVLDTLGIDDTE